MRLGARELFLLLLLTIHGIAAQGQVSRIDGRIADGERVVIQGTGFGEKPNDARPYAFFDFGRNRAEASQYSRHPWGAPAAGILANDLRAPNGSASWKFRMGVDGRGDAYTGPRGGGTRFDPKPSGRYLYVFYRIYFNWDGRDAYAKMPNWNLKGFRIWASGTRYPDIYMPGYPGGSDDPTGSPLVYAEGTDGGPLWLSPKEVHGIRKNEWKVEELFLRQSSAVNAADGLWYMASNGRKSSSLSNLVTRSSAYPDPYTDLFWHQVERTGFTASDNKFFAYDVVYIDDSWARVVVTESSTWNDNAEGRLEIQVPVSWSDNRIEVVLRRGVLDSLSGKYLYVFKADGNPVSRNGFRLSGQGEVAPMPPTAVTVD